MTDVIPPMPPMPPVQWPPLPSTGGRPTSNKKATASLVLGLVGLAVPIVFPIGLIFGWQGLKKARSAGVPGSGRGKAMAGIILGFVNLASCIVWPIFIYFRQFHGTCSYGEVQRLAWSKVEADARVREALGVPLERDIAGLAGFKKDIPADPISPLFETSLEEWAWHVYGPKGGGTVHMKLVKSLGGYRLGYLSIDLPGQRTIVLEDHEGEVWMPIPASRKP